MNKNKFHWSNVSSNPNEIGLRHTRAGKIQNALRKNTVNRIEYICTAAQGKSVLDVGCVSHETSAEISDEWLHRRIRDAAERCLGVDILEPEIDELKAKGYNVAVHDLCRAPMSDEFELVVCGEIIEHLPSPGTFLENVKRSLTSGGILMFSTPYPWFLGTILRNCLSGHYLPGSMDHVAWYDPSTISEIADRYGFEIEEIVGIDPLPSETSRGLQEKIYKLVRKRLIPFFTILSGCRSVLYVLKKAND